MERALRNRLLFGTVMLAALAGVLWLDWAFESWTRDWMNRRYGLAHGVGGLGLAIMLAIITPLANPSKVSSKRRLTSRVKKTPAAPSAVTPHVNNVAKKA